MPRQYDKSTDIRVKSEGDRVLMQTNTANIWISTSKAKELATALMEVASEKKNSP